MNTVMILVSGAVTQSTTLILCRVVTVKKLNVNNISVTVYIK